MQVEDNARVNVAGPGAHDQPGEGGHAHGGVDGLLAFNSGAGCPVAEVEGDLVDGSFGQLHEFGNLVGHVFVAGAVEAVSTHTRFGRQFFVHGVERCGRRHAVEEAGIKHRHVWHIGQEFARNLDAINVSRVM